MERCEVFPACGSVVISCQTLPACHLRPLQRALLNYSLTSSLVYATAAFNLSAVWWFYLKYLLSHGLCLLFFEFFFTFCWHLIVLLWKTWCSLGNRAYFFGLRMLKPSSVYSEMTSELDLLNWSNSVTSEFSGGSVSCCKAVSTHFSSQHTCGRTNQQNRRKELLLLY